MTDRAVRQGSGFFRSEYGWVDSAEAVGLAALGVAVWGVPSVEAAVLAGPFAFRVLQWIAFALTVVAVQIAFIGTDRRISFCSVGHFMLVNSGGRMRFAWNQDGLFAGGVILEEIRPTPGHANCMTRLRIGLGVQVGLIGLLLLLCVRSYVLTAGPTWFCIGECTVLLLSVSAMRTRKFLASLSQAALAEGGARKGAGRDLMSLMRSGTRPREYPLDLVNDAFQLLSQTPFAAGRDMLTYFVMVDRGNWMAAAAALNDCLAATEQGRLSPIQVINPFVTDVYGMAAVHFAWVDGDPDRAARALAMCDRAWMSSPIRTLAEAAISLRRGDWTSAEVSGRRAMDQARAESESGISVLLADWAEHIVGAAARRESGPNRSNVPRLSFDPPMLFGPVYALTDWPSVIWLLRTIRLFCWIMLAWLGLSPWAPILFALCVVGILMMNKGVAQGTVALHARALELSPRGIVVRWGVVNARFSWQDVTAVATKSRRNGDVSGLRVLPVAADELKRVDPRGVIPLGDFEPDWLHGSIGSIIWQAAPHVFEPTSTAR